MTQQSTQKKRKKSKKQKGTWGHDWNALQLNLQQTVMVLSNSGFPLVGTVEENRKDGTSVVHLANTRSGRLWVQEQVIRPEEVMGIRKVICAPDGSRAPQASYRPGFFLALHGQREGPSGTVNFELLHVGQTVVLEGHCGWPQLAVVRGHPDEDGDWLLEAFQVSGGVRSCHCRVPARAIKGLKNTWQGPTGKQSQVAWKPGVVMTLGERPAAPACCAVMFA